MATNGTQDTTAVEFPRSVDLGGDANLLVGPKGSQVRIRVCKALLCFASKYFNALFSSKFSEGGLAEQGQDVMLGEDEPDAVVNLCKILHMKYTWPTPMNPKELLHLAIVADKYDCVKAIHLAVQPLFRTGTFSCDCWGARDLIVASYLLGHPRYFCEYTKMMLAHYSYPLAEIGVSEVGRRIPISTRC
jgi:hypothetical protein